MNKEQLANTIAIVGLGLQFPGANSSESYWERLCAAQDLSRSLEERWDFHPDLNQAGSTAPDCANNYRGYIIDKYPENRRYGALDHLPESLDPLFLLPLAAAEKALEKVSVPNERTGLIMAAIALPTEATSELTRETLGQIVAKRTCADMPLLSSSDNDAHNIDSSTLPHPWNKDAVGRCGSLVAQAFDLRLGSYTIDAACASSLIAVHLACEELRANRADAMLAGGLSRPDCLYTQMGFSALKALSRSGQCRPFDKEGDGLMVGEGCGLIVLKRLPDALRDGDTIYGVIRGIGVSNDLAGSLVAPATEGQLRAMHMAYDNAELAPQDMDWVECHGTGTPTGDKVELSSLIELWNENAASAPKRPCYLTSVKAMIGHLLTGAGIASLLRVILSLEHKQFTPQVNFKTPLIDFQATPFAIPTANEEWKRRSEDTPRRAAVSGFGFGGINAHVIIEEWDAELNATALQELNSTEASKPNEKAPSQNSSFSNEPIAIVGMACHIGEANNLAKFRHHVLSGETLIKERPESRWWNAEKYLHTQQNATVSEDQAVALEQGEPEEFQGDLAKMPGAFIDKLEIPVGRYRIPPTDIPALLPQQLLMLQVADQALADAKLSTSEKRVDGGALIGLGLDLNTTNYQLRWWLTSLVKRWSAQLNLSANESAKWLQDVREAAQRPLDSVATMGALGSIVASRVAREFHFGGPSYAISSGENSGLDALQSACRFLQRGEINVALVGAVDLSGDLRNWINSELPLGQPHPLDDRAQGTVAGEGAVALVVKRLSDAQADGDHIYSVIRGWGQAGRPSNAIEPLYAAEPNENERAAQSPRPYLQALQAAYKEANIAPQKVSYIETSGISVPQEDYRECEALQAFFNDGATPCALGALSSITGHLGACAGLASLLKASLCLDSQILPPVAGFTTPLQEEDLDWEHSRFHMPQKPAYWFRNRQDGSRLVGVSCQARDGQCVHAVLEGYETVAGPQAGTVELDKVALFPIYGNTIQELCANLDSLSTLSTEYNSVVNTDASYSRLSSNGTILNGLDLANGDLNKLDAITLNRLSRAWWSKMVAYRSKRMCLAIVAEVGDVFSAKIGLAYEHLRDNPDKATEWRGIYFTPEPLAAEGKVAFVYPGSGSHFLGMGREIYARFPNILHAQDLQNRRLMDQYMVRFAQPYNNDWSGNWKRKYTDILAADTHKLMFSQVSFGTAMTDIVRSLGIEAQSIIGYSLGESTALFSTHAWPMRDEMLERMESSDLFRQKLSQRYLALREAWNMPEPTPIEWTVAMVPLPASRVQEGLDKIPNTRLLIINTDDECVVGGLHDDILHLCQYLQVKPILLPGVDAVHCDALQPVAEEYRDMHTLRVVPQDDLTYYSGHFGKSYEISSSSVANSIVNHGVNGIDYPKTIRQAWEDGARLFIEMGPNSSCSRMIRKILHDRPHCATSVSMRGRSEVVTLTHMLAMMQAYGLRPDPLPSACDTLGDRSDSTTSYITVLTSQTAAPKHAATHKTAAIPATDKVLAVTASAKQLSNGHQRLAVEPKVASFVSQNAQVQPLGTVASTTISQNSSSTTSDNVRGFTDTSADQERYSSATYVAPAPYAPSSADGQTSVTSAASTPDHSDTIVASIPTPSNASFSMYNNKPQYSPAMNSPVSTVIAWAQESYQQYEQWLQLVDQQLRAFESPRPQASPASPMAQVVSTVPSTTVTPMAPSTTVTPMAPSATDNEITYMMAGKQHSCIGGYVRGYKPNLHPETPVFLNREQCLNIATGKIGDVLGKQFAEIDSYPTHVRLPDEPLMLVDRVLSVEGEPLSLGSGRLVTEHDVLPGSWYLDGNRAPVFLSVEAGQADLFLSGWLGIDKKTKGERVYRLLDATVSFHRGLPQPGETVHYDIKIDRFVHQGQTWLFFFKYEATIGDELFLTMYNGCAGFFTHKEINENRGLVLTDAEKLPQQGKIAPDYHHLVELTTGSYSEAQIDALRRGDLEYCFGSNFAGLALRNPARLPDGLLRLIHRVPVCDPFGGRWGLGMVQAESDVHPDDWYLTCHFVDDMVMPGTLMYECCAHALRVLLTRMGWVGEHDEVCYEPVPGCNATLKCRGPVLQTTKKVLYQVEIKEIGYRPEPYVIADALMYADGKMIVGFQDISMQMSGQNRDALERLWAQRQVNAAHATKLDNGNTTTPQTNATHAAKIANTNATIVPANVCTDPNHRGDVIKPAIFDTYHLLQFAIGKPSEAFGPEFARFDDAFIARLPGPPYQFLSRIVSIDHPFLQLAPGGWVEAQYDVPEDAWYFQANKQASMPYCVLLEIPLQACGWLSAYAGSSRTSETKLQYRNLGGTATLYREIFPDTGTITTKVRMTKCSQAGGLIIQSFDFWLGQENAPIYEGTTTFGFFTPSSLANQVGVRGAKEIAPGDYTHLLKAKLPGTDPIEPTDCHPATVRGLSMPGKALLMCDEAEWYEKGGSHHLGFMRGTKRVDVSEWFFKAHFFQDPVIPGSLGLESFLQLLKVAAMQFWPEQATTHRFNCVLDNEPHTWIYRGQIIPTNKVVTVEADIVEVREEPTPIIKANGFVRVDGLTIYEMQDFGISLVPLN